MTEDRSDSSDKFREFVKKMARLLVPEDDVEEVCERRRQAAHETGCPVEELTDEDVIVNADDELLCRGVDALESDPRDPGPPEEFRRIDAGAL
jgi:hypothetical protein